MTRLERIYEIFEEHWGEERIDWFRDTNRFIIWYPEVTVSNEENESTVIRNLYIKFHIDDNGLLAGGIYVTKTTFTEAQWQSRYIHSHVQRWNSADKWKPPCFGTSPLSRTVHLLSTEYNEVSWELFVDQLDSFTEIESLHGGPYLKIRDVNSGVSSGQVLAPNHKLFINNSKFVLPYEYSCAFIYWLIRNCKDEITVMDHIYTFARTDYDLTVWMSAEYCKWYNEFRKVNSNTEILKDSGIIVPCCKVGSIYYDSCEHSDSYPNEYVLTFKGERKYLNIIPSVSRGSITYILRPIVVVQTCLLLSALTGLTASMKPFPKELCINLL